MKKTNAIKSLLAVTLLTTSMSGWFGYNNYNDQKEIEQLHQEQDTILDNHTDLISNLESLEYELNTYKETNVDLKELIDTKNVEIKELENQVSVKEAAKKKEEAKKKQVVVSRGGSSNYKEYSMKVTHYSAQCYKCSGIGASGVDLRGITYYQGHRIIATDPNVIPLWSVVKMETPQGEFTAISLDTGGKIVGGVADLLVSSNEEAFELGVYQNVRVTVLREGKK